jgi:hypothetical protein
MTLLSTKSRAKRRRFESRTSSGIAPANKRQNPAEVNTSKIGWQFPAPTSTTGIRRDDGDGSGKSRTPPSLYLIIVSRATRLAPMAHRSPTDIPIHIVTRSLQFLTLLCVLICSSSFIIIRGWLQRRRIRVEIQQAVDRGEITARRGEQLNVRLDTMTWSMGRWSASWLTLLSDDLAERSNPMYGRTGGRRRRKARDLGPVPKLYEFEMKEEKENRDGRASVYSNELPAYQVSHLPYCQ